MLTAEPYSPGSPGHQAPVAWTRGADQLDANDFDPLCSGTIRFLSETGQVPRVTGEQDDRPGLIECDHGEERIERAPVTRQPGPPEQLPSRTPPLRVDRDHRDPPEHAVHASIPGTAAQHFGESRRGGDDVATPPSGNLEEVPRLRVAAGQLDETFGIENQRAAYSSS
jgi:hypothetical protein